MSIAVKLGAEADRAKVMSKLAEEGIDSRPYFPAIHLQAPYRKEFGTAEGQFPVAEETSRRSLALPFFTDMTLGQVGRVVAALARAIA
jgi:perosamine synthetase